MSENSPEVRTVQQYRREARNVLTKSREALAIRTKKTRAVYTLVNGTIESIIAGRPGYTQEQQVERLDSALSTVEENKAKIAEAVAAAKAEVLEVIESWDTIFAEALEAAEAALVNGRDLARDRDFDAWQEQKRARGVAPAFSPAYDED